MKEIKLSQSGKNKDRFVALVDDDDYKYLSQKRWCVNNLRGNLYALRNEKINGKQITILMHRLIMNPPVGLEVDHIDRNGLNNQKSNLRICTHMENVRNSPSQGKTSIYLGVSYDSKNKKYIAGIKVDYKQIYLGAFDTEEEAAIIRDIASLKYFGEFANLNFK
jgi:hypothetical protein